MITLRLIAIALVFVAIIHDAALIGIFYGLRRILDSSAWHYIINGFILAFINNSLLGLLITFKPTLVIQFTLIILFFGINATKQILWAIGFAKFRNNMSWLIKEHESLI